MFKELQKDENVEGMRRQASRPLAYENYYLRSSNEFVLKDKTLRKGTQIDKNNRLISENPKRRLNKRKKY
jgi:hypothetical protein